MEKGWTIITTSREMKFTMLVNGAKVGPTEPVKSYSEMDRS
jgi:hypothetical protein